MLWISEEGFSSGINVCNISSFVTLTLCAVVGFLHDIDALDWGIAPSLHLWTRSIPSFVSSSSASCLDSIPSFCFGFSSIELKFEFFFFFCFGFFGIALEFDLFVLFRVLWHHAWIQSLPFISSSPASRWDLIPSFYFGFSGIVLEFDPFVLFQVLQHRARIRSLCFVLGSPTSCPDSIPSFCFRFYGIVPEFNPFLLFFTPASSFVSSSLTSCLDSIPSFCFGFLGIVLEFNPLILFWVLRHRARISLSSSTSCMDSSSSSASCLDFIIFFGIASRFPYLHRHHVQTTHLPKHCAWVSLSPLVIATQFH